MLQRYQNILKKSAVNTDGLSLDTSIDSQDGSTHKFDDDSTQDTDFYSTFISNYRFALRRTYPVFPKFYAAVHAK